MPYSNMHFVLNSLPSGDRTRTLAQSSKRRHLLGLSGMPIHYPTPALSWEPVVVAVVANLALNRLLRRISLVRVVCQRLPCESLGPGPDLTELS